MTFSGVNERTQRQRVFVLVDSFEIYQAWSVLVGWPVGVGTGATVPSVPAQTNGRFRIRKHESTSTESEHAQKHARTQKSRTAEKHEAQAAQSTNRSKARIDRKHESIESTKAQNTESTESTEQHAPRKRREGRTSRWGLAGVGPAGGNRLALRT